MRVFFAIFIFSMFRIWSVEAAEPIVVLTYGESRESFGSGVTVSSLIPSHLISFLAQLIV